MTYLQFKYRSFLILLLLALSTTLFSQDETIKHPILTSKYEIRLGLFYPSERLEMSVNGSAKNDEFRFGKAFGLQENNLTVFTGFGWRFAPKWKLSIDYFGTKNSNSRTLENDIHWKDYTIKKGTYAYGMLGFNIFRVYAGRLFSTGAKHEFGGGIGVHSLDFKTLIEGEVLTSEGDKKFETISESLVLPLPNLGVWYYFAPNNKWAFVSHLDVFYLTLGDISGHLINFTPGVNYQVLENFSIAANYRFINIGAEFINSYWDGNIGFGFKGPSVTINANF